MDPSPRQPDDAIIPAGALSPHWRDDAIKAGPPRGGFTPAAPRPTLSDQEVRELVEAVTVPAPQPPTPYLHDYVVKGGLWGGAVGVGLTFAISMVVFLKEMNEGPADMLMLLLASLGPFVCIGIPTGVVGMGAGAILGVLCYLSKLHSSK